MIAEQQDPLPADRQAAPKRGRPRHTRAVRALGRFVLRLLVGVALIVLLFGIMLQIPPFSSLVGRSALRLFNPWPGTSVSIGSVRGSWVSSLSLTDVRITGSSDSLLISIDTLRVSYDLSALFGGTLHLRQVFVYRPIVRTRFLPEGDLVFLRAFASSDTVSYDTSAGLRIKCDHLEVHNGEFALFFPSEQSIQALNVKDIELRADSLRVAGSVEARIDTLHSMAIVDGQTPNEVTLDAAGAIRADSIQVRSISVASARSHIEARGSVPLPLSLVHSLPGADLKFSASPISYSDLHPFLPGFGPEGEARIDLLVARHADSSRGSLNLRFPGGGTIAVQTIATRMPGERLALNIAGACQRFSPSSVQGPPDTSESIVTRFALAGTGGSPVDASGTFNMEISSSTIAGIGPVEGTVTAEVRHGDIHAAIRGYARSVRVSADALISPFDPMPVYDVRGSIAVRPTDDSESPLRRFGGLAAEFAVAGRGFDPDSALAHLVLKGKWRGNPHFDSFMVEGDFHRDTLHASGNIVTPGGSLHTIVDAILGEIPVYTIRVPAFRHISLASFGKGMPQSSLTGSLVAEGSGTSLDDLTGEVTLALDSSHVADIAVKRLRTDIGIERGRIRVAGVTESDAGSISLKGSASLLADAPYVTLEQAQFQGIDLGRILGTKGMSSDLNGSVQVHAAARSMRDVLSLMQDSLSDGNDAIQVNGILTLHGSRLNRQSIRAGTIGVAFLGGALETSMEIRTPEGGAAGRAQVYPFGRTLMLSVPALKLDHLDIGALSGSRGLKTDLSAVIRGSLRGETVERSTGELSIDLEPSMINTHALTDGSLRATIEEGRFVIRSVTNLADGHAVVDASGLLIRGGARGKLSVDVALRDSSSGHVSDTLDPAQVLVRGVLEGGWGSPSETDLTGTLLGHGSYQGLRVDTIRCAVAVHGRTLVVDTVQILSNALAMAAGGTLALFDPASTTPSDFSLSASVTSLQPLEGILGLPPTLLRSTSFSLHASGPPESTAVFCRTNVNSAAVGDLVVMSLQGSLDMLLGTSAGVQSMTGKAEVRGFHYGSLTMENASLLLRSLGNTYEIASTVKLDRESTIRLVGSVRDETDSLEVVVDTLTAISPGGNWTLAQQATIIYGPRIVVRDFALHSGSRDLVVGGVLDPKGDQDFVVSAESLDVRNMGKLLGRPDLDGLMFIDARVEGPAGNAHAVGYITVSLRNRGEDLGNMSAQVDWKANALLIDGHIEQPDGGRLSATARLPFALRPPESDLGANAESSDTSGAGPFDVLLKAEKFNLAFFRPVLSPQTISSLSGALTADIHATGSLDSIVAVGVISVDSGRIGITPLGVVYSGIRIHCTATGDTLHFGDAETVSGDGMIGLSGFIVLKKSAKTAFNIRATANKFLAVQTPDLKANVTGDVLLTGGGGKPTVTGTLAINDSYVVIPEAGKGGAVETVELTEEDYTMLLRYFGYRPQVATVERGPSAIEPTISLTLEMRQNTWIRKRLNPTLAIALQGSIRIERQPGQSLRLIGTLRPVAGRSYVGQFGRQFEITSGELVFKGPLEESDLRIESEYEVPSKSGSGLSEVVIRMRVESNLGRFVFSLTSDPAMDESEILSYLATGQSKTGALANTADQGGLAGAMAVEQLVGMAGGLTEGSVPVDVFQIRQDGARGITIVAGNYVNPKTYLGIRQPILFSQGTQDTYYDTRTQYELEYEARPWLFLNLQGGSSRTLLFLKARYAY